MKRSTTNHSLITSISRRVWVRRRSILVAVTKHFWHFLVGLSFRLLNNNLRSHPSLTLQNPKGFGWDQLVLVASSTNSSRYTYFPTKTLTACARYCCRCCCTHKSHVLQLHYPIPRATSRRNSPNRARSRENPDGGREIASAETSSRISVLVADIPNDARPPR